MGLEKDILLWDGKSAEDIGAIFNAHKNKPGFTKAIVDALESLTLQKGASWLLKAWFEAGGKLEKEHILSVYTQLNNLDSWEAKVHILQCMPYMPVAKKVLKNVDAFLRFTLTDTNKFVRAWSYNGFYELACQYPEYRAEANQFFDMAMKDEAASVKARIRNILKKGYS